MYAILHWCVNFVSSQFDLETTTTKTHTCAPAIGRKWECFVLFYAKYIFTALIAFDKHLYVLYTLYRKQTKNNQEIEKQTNKQIIKRSMRTAHTLLFNHNMIYIFLHTEHFSHKYSLSLKFRIFPTINETKLISNAILQNLR